MLPIDWRLKWKTDALLLGVEHALGILYSFMGLALTYSGGDDT